MMTASALYETELRSADLESRPGGLFRVDINGSDVARDEYVVLEPPSRLVWSWGWEGEGEGHPLPPGASTVEITLRADGDVTILRMVHSGFVDADMVASHGEVWDHILPRLIAVSEGRDFGPDEWTTPQDSVTSETAG